MIPLLAISLVVEEYEEGPLSQFSPGYTISILLKTKSDAKRAQGARVSEKDEEGNTPLHLVMCFQTSLGNVACSFIDFYLHSHFHIKLCQFSQIFYFIPSTFNNELYIRPLNICTNSDG